MQGLAARDPRLPHVFHSAMPELRHPSMGAIAALGAGVWWRDAIKLGRCPVCGLCVRADDAIGLVGSRVSHAECALARWNGFGALPWRRSADGLGRGDVSASDPG
jgi:hypothetical protein